MSITTTLTPLNANRKWFIKAGFFFISLGSPICAFEESNKLTRSFPKRNPYKYTVALPVCKRYQNIQSVREVTFR